MHNPTVPTAHQPLAPLSHQAFLVKDGGCVAGAEIVAQRCGCQLCAGKHDLSEGAGLTKRPQEVAVV